MKIILSLLAISLTGVAGDGYTLQDAPPTWPAEEQFVYLQCGNGNACGYPTDVAGLDETHELRCCSDTAITGNSWKLKNGCWGGSKVGANAQCYDAVTYAEGVALCKESNARMCSRAEIEAKCAQGTGCSHDADHVWTYDKAPPPGPLPGTEDVGPDAHLWLSCGSGKQKCGLKYDIQAKATELHEVRCCARKPVTGWRKQSGCAIWNEADLFAPDDVDKTGGKMCYHASTYAEAQEICAAQDPNSYVCTKEDVDSGCAKGSGCSHDVDHIWTSDVAPAFGENPGQADVDPESYLFLACGDGGKCNGKKLAVAQAQETHEVMCCSQSALGAFKIPGKKKCRNHFQSELLDAEGNGPAQCFDASTYAEAQAICAANDAYVCTKEEILNKCTKGAPCGRDNDLVWTSTPALPSAVQKWAAKEAQATAIGGVCTATKGTISGDPHFKTFDKVTYDCQGHGEYVVAAAKANDPLKIHGRFVRGDWSGKPTVTRAVGIKVLEDVPPVHVTVPDVRNGAEICPMSYSIGTDETAIASTDIISYFETNYAGKVNVFQSKNTVIFTFPGKSARVQVTSGGRGQRGCVLNTNVCITPNQHGGADNIVGLLGTPNGDKTDDWMENTPEGASVAQPEICDAITNKSTKAEKKACKNALKKQGHDYCVANWCVADAADSLWTPATHAMYNECTSDSDDDFFDRTGDPDQDIVDACAEMEDPENCEADVVVAVEGGADLEEVTDGLTQDEEDNNLVENLNEEDAEELLEDFSGPEVPEVASTEAITLPDNFPEEDPVVEDAGEGPGDGGDGGDGGEGSSSGSQGDPHFKTWLGEHFEYHGQCDLVLMKDLAFAENLGIQVQIRTKLIRFWSYIRSASIRIGDDILEVVGTGAGNIDELAYWYNLQERGEMKTVGGFPVTAVHNGAHKQTYTIDLSSKYPGQSIVISSFKEFVKVDFKGANVESFGNAVGMLGDFKTGDTLSRDGQVLDDFIELGNQWQVRPEDDMLFHDIQKPQFPTGCINPEDPRGERRRRLDESSIKEEEAEKACAQINDPLDRKDCVYDILATQDMDMVGAY